MAAPIRAMLMVRRIGLSQSVGPRGGWNGTERNPIGACQDPTESLRWRQLALSAGCCDHPQRHRTATELLVSSQAQPAAWPELDT